MRDALNTVSRLGRCRRIARKHGLSIRTDRSETSPERFEILNSHGLSETPGRVTLQKIEAELARIETRGGA